ncbi:hypothetical protein DFH05DRAFT_1484996 [Lentinula detonsa]|uniref:AB hydrolase-1 domain-containing protein n=1 Tax=Lentinula detonsa TaxID=2804962 RepID=A0A9W8P3T3_9AGAR|nr:hypothetical protein DFH05DRAFT_1484996 [Lentinula detonsa]
MLGTTLYEYISILISITLLRLVAPTSFLYLLSCLYTKSFTLNGATPPWIFLLALFESFFYLFVYVPRKKALQKSVYTAPPLNREQREALFLRCSKHISFSVTESTPELSSTYPNGWFLTPNPRSTPNPRLKRENLIEWILWALFSCNPHEAKDSWKDEIDGYVRQIEGITKVKFENGRDEGMKALRLTLDEVKMVHRPLVWYIIVALVDLITSIKLYTMNFYQYSSPTHPQFFPPRLFSIFSTPSPSVTDHFSYWYRPHKSSDRDPIVFIHGIGIGLHPYIPFLQDLIQLDPDQGILLIELLPVSMHICSSTSIPPRREMLDAIYTTMHSLGISRAVLASHSYGTIIAAHVIRDSQETNHRSNTEPNQTSTESSSPQVRFTSHLLIDPIPILLHLPAVAFNFLYRVPREANEWQLWYFASRDPDVAYTLGRCFFWAEGVLWREDFGVGVDVDMAPNSKRTIKNPHESQPTNQTSKVQFAIILSGKDQIVPAPLVRKYLTGEDEVKERWLSGSNVDPHSSDSDIDNDNDSNSLEVLYYPTLDHAMVFDTEERRRGMIRVLARFTRLGGRG